MRNVRPVFVVCDPGVSQELRQAALEGIAEIIELAGVTEHVQVKNFGAWRHDPYRESTGALIPHNSVEWYLFQGQTGSRGPDQLNARMIMQKLVTAPRQKVQRHYDVFLVANDMYEGRRPFVVGTAKRCWATIVSRHLFRDLKPLFQKECFKTAVMRGLGRVFGLVPGYCTNGCIMGQAPTLKGDWLGLTSERRMSELAPLCPKCLQNLRDFFADDRRKA